MKLFYTLMNENRVLAIHQTLAGARQFAKEWRDVSGANRVAERIVSGIRENSNIYSRSDRFKVNKVVEEFSL